MADELNLQNLSISSFHDDDNDANGDTEINERNQSTQEAEEATKPLDIILSCNTNLIKEYISLRPSGILICGSDRRTRRAIVQSINASIPIKSVCKLVLDFEEDDDDMELKHDNDMICIDDIDFDADDKTHIDIILKSFFTRNITVIGLVSSEDNVSVNLKRAGRFEIVHKVISPSLNDRQTVWTYILNLFHLHHDEKVTRHIAEITPSFQLHDFSKVVHQFNSMSSSSSRKSNKKNDLKSLLNLIESHQPIQQEMFMIDLPFISSSSLIQAGTREREEDDDEDGEWGSHVGYSEIKSKLTQFITWPIIYDATFKRLSLTSSKGLLIHGDSGSGKTLLMQSFIKHHLNHANYFYLNGNDIFCKYLGESEKRLRLLFSKARELSPCVIIIDDMDIIACKRDLTSNSTGIERRLLATLLTELDGIQSNDVFVIGCVRQLDSLDTAVCRPGRLDIILKLNEPDRNDRKLIILRLLRHVQFTSNADKISIVHMLADVLEGSTPADIEAVCKEAIMLVMEETEEKETNSSSSASASALVGAEQRHFDMALQQMNFSTLARRTNSKPNFELKF